MLRNWFGNTNGAKGVLEAAVEALHHTAGLWMVGCGWPVLNLK
jgi:hypothetical protein